MDEKHDSEMPIKDSLSEVVVTHYHLDHVQGLKSLLNLVDELQEWQRPVAVYYGPKRSFVQRIWQLCLSVVLSVVLKSPDRLRLCGLLRYCLPRKTQEEIYDPAHNELLEDHLESRNHRTEWVSWCFYVRFRLRMLLLFADCGRLVFQNKLAGLVRDWIRKWRCARPRF